MKYFTLLLLLIIGSLNTFGQDIIGSWGGAIKTDSAQVLIYMHIEVGEDSKYSANYDLPGLNKFGIPFTQVTFQSNTLQCIAQELGISYEAGLRGDEFNGVWRQAGRAAALSLVRMDSPTK